MDDLINTKEKKILASLFRLDDRSVSKLAKDTGINRTTLYPVLDRLLKKGLVSKVDFEGKTLFTAISKEEFKKWLARKKVESVEAINNTSDWLENELAEEKPSLVSEISYFEGRSGVENLYDDSWRNNAEKEIKCITDYRAAQTMIDFFQDDYWPERLKHGIKVQNLMTESKQAYRDRKDAKRLLRDLRFTKGLFENLGIEINLYDDKTSIIAYDEKSPAGILIKNQKITNALKNIFDYLWQSAK